jgi:uncharacterized protein involved in cysteine biosynthesis
MALGAIILVIVNLVQGDDLMVVAWTVSFTYWMILSYVDYNAEKIKLLEKKQERDDRMYELVQELVKANKIDREVMKKYEERLKKLEDRR